MRVNRPRLLSEDGGQPQSAIINKRMGMEWQALSKAEQQPYFDMAAKEREEHLMKHPDWTARDNYAVKKKQKKKAREKSRGLYEVLIIYRLFFAMFLWLILFKNVTIGNSLILFAIESY